MLRYVFHLLVLLALTGCTTVRYTWEHPDEPGAERLAQDKQECRVIVVEEATYPYPGYPYRHHFYHRSPWPYYPYAPYAHHYDYWPYGYGWYQDPFAWQYYRDDLFRVCMRAKGWHRVPVEEQ